MYDAETKTVTLTPKTALNEGTPYKVLVNASVLAENGLNLTGNTEFTITTTGYVINDTFDDGTDCGWVSGAGNKVMLTAETLETGEKVLKADMPQITLASTWDANSKQSTIKKEANIKFTGDNLIRIKAKVKNADATDEYLIKVNRPNSTSQGLPLYEGMFNMYMVTGLNGGKPMYGQDVSTSAGVTNSYKNMAALPKKADGTAFDYTGVDLTGKWIDYTVIINGATNEQWVTASFDVNGETVTLIDEHAYSTFKQTDPAYDWAGRTAEKTFEAFERLTFASRDSSGASTLYIDSVSVENIKALDTKAQILANSVEKDGAIKVQLLANGEIDSMPEGAIKIEGVQASSSYDKETKTVTLTPKVDLTEGTTYKVIVNKDVLVALGINYVGTTSFEVRCRGAFSEGKVIDDTFDTANDIGTWRAGKTNGNTVTVQQTTFDGKGVMMFTADGTFNQNLHGRDGNIITPVGNGIEFKEDKKIVIETSVYKTAENSTFDLKFNRPDAVQQVEKERIWATYGIFRMPGNKRVDYITHHLLANGSTPYWSAQKAVEGTEEVITTGKWVDYKITLDGFNNSYDMDVTIDGETYKMTGGEFSVPGNALEKAFGIGTTKDNFDSLDTLTFKISHKDTIYVDYIKVYEVTEQEATAEFLVNGQTVETFNIGDNVKPSFTLSPEGKETTYTVISALYVGGILDDVHINTVTTDELTTYTEEDGYVINAEEAANTTVKAFVWAGDDLTAPSPASLTAELKPNPAIPDK